VKSFLGHSVFGFCLRFGVWVRVRVEVGLGVGLVMALGLQLWSHSV